MIALTYHIHLLEPLLATALDGDPNSAVSHNYIPGSLIRGALIGMFLKQTGLSELDVTNADVRRVFFSDDTQYLNAYPAIDSVRALPLPKSWHVQKGKETPVYDLALATADVETPKQIESGFGVIRNGTLLTRRTKRFIAVHTQRDRKKGRATEASGAVYRYESLAAGQTFAGAILCESDHDANWVQTILTEGLETHIGGARSAGYGRVRFEQVQKSAEREEVPSLFQPTERLVVTLLSDAILRNEQGEYEPTAAALRLTLARRLGIAQEHVGTIAKTDARPLAYVGTTVVGGFNRKWGLPLPQVSALAMGSTVVFENHALTAEQASYLMRWGIGERRTEGFGRVGINLFSAQQFEATKVDLHTTEQSQGERPLIYSVLPQTTARRALQRKIDLQVVQLTNGITFVNLPRSSQINALRAEVQRTLRADPMNRTQLDETLKHIEERAGSRRQFEKARIKGKSLVAWVRDMIDDTRNWTELKDAKTDSLLAQSDLSEALVCRRFNLSLIDAVLARAAKSSKREVSHE